MSSFFKFGHLFIDDLLFGSKSLLLEVFKVSGIWHNLFKGVIRIGGRYRKEIFAVDENTPLLQNAEGSVRASLLHIPKELVLDALRNQLVPLLTFLMPSRAIFLSSASSFPFPSAS